MTVVAGLSLIVGVRRVLESDGIERHTYELIGRLQDARASVRSAFSNMRAYMLTADRHHQQQYFGDLELTRKALDKFTDLTGPAPEIQADSNKLYVDFNKVTTAMTAAMANREDFGKDFLAKFEDSSLNGLISKTETDMGAALGYQNARLDTLRDKRYDDFFLTQLAFVCTMLFGTASLILAGVGVKREAAQRAEAEVLHNDARQDLLTAQAVMEFADKKDPLTGLLNKEAFHAILEREYEKSEKTKTPVSIVILDIDEFSQVRDVRGEHTCELVVRQMTGILRDSFRGADVCCRLSESEFGIILPRTQLQHASIAAERTRAAVEKAQWPDCHITASLGVAQSDYLKDKAELVARGEQAVDYARRTGRNRVTAIRAYLPLSA
ncbi:MAG: hypothetical protein QOJ65_1678 [Fimbriimonadaceae bacterium]|jgi:diguanylate cyclase (GGDEF)-like protein|nr:hypothetical protein [Fimbriimonadaceae bacterium]